MEFEKLLEKISLNEYRKFVLLYSLKNPEFKTELEVYFSAKDEKIDLSKKYREWIKKTIRKYERKGFIDYNSSFGLAGELQIIINTGFVLVEEHNFLDAFKLAKVAMTEMMQVIIHSDDSSGRIGDTIEFCIQLLERIVNDPYAGNPLKEQIFFYLDTVLKEDIYFDYGDFGYRLLAVFEVLALKIGQTEIFLKHLNGELSKPAEPYSDYNNNFYKIKKVEFLTVIGRLDEADELVAQNMDIVEIRQGVVNRGINEQDYLQAKILIDSGIKIAEEKNHPGTVSYWQKELLRIAFLERDIEIIRHYSKHFAFDRGFDKAYYQIWKETYLPDEWPSILEVYIQEHIAGVNAIYERNKERDWLGQSMLSLLSVVASIYVEENYLDRLLVLVKQEKELTCILHYHEVLLKDYQPDLLLVYLPAFEKAGVNVNDRKQYQNLVKQMKKIIKDIPDGKEQILNLANEWRIKYYRRPAMVEELTKLIGD